MLVEASGEFNTRDVFWGTLLLGEKYLLFFSLSGIAILVLAIYAGNASGEGWFSQPLWELVGVFVLAYPFFVLFSKSNKIYKSSPIARGKILYSFGEGAINFQGQHSSATLKWTGVVKWNEGKHTFLVYTSRQRANMIPKRFFASREDIETVRVLMRGKVGPPGVSRRAEFS